MPRLNFAAEFAPQRRAHSLCPSGVWHSPHMRECHASRSGGMAQRRSGANSSTSLRNGTLSTTDGCDRGARPRILRHCTRDLRAGRRDASATSARHPASSLALHRRARQAVIPRRSGPKVHRLPRRKVTEPCCLLLSRASRHNLLPGSVARFTAGRRVAAAQTSLGGYKRPPYGRLRKASARSRRRPSWPRMAYPRHALLTGAVPVGGLAGPVPL